MFTPDEILTDIFHGRPCVDDTLMLMGPDHEDIATRAVLIGADGRVDTVVHYDTPLDFLLLDVEPQVIGCRASP